MDIREFVDEYGTDKAEDVFERAGSTRKYMIQIKTGQRQPSIKLVKALIKASHGKLTRERLRPDFYT